LDELYPLHQLTAFAIGLCLGSFLNVCILRIPEDRSLWSPPSACPVCGTAIAWHDNVPVLSWLVLRARCRSCHTPISPMYPLIELLMGLLAWLLFRRFVPTPAHVDAANLAAWTVYTGFVFLVLLAAYTDLRTRIIPELASLWAIPIGLGAAALLEGLGYHGWLAIGWRASVLGALLGGASMGGLALIWRALFGREGLGNGDVRLVAMMGAFLGPLPGLWMVLLLGSFLGAFAGLLALSVLRRSAFMPFGPSLSAAGILYVLYGDVIVARLFPNMARLL
jgi:leader peptidase (prepilin peptidase)/N-methyltransferase